VPEWIHASVVEEHEPDPLLSLGKRKRNEVNYKEHFNDKTFNKMIEEGLDQSDEKDVKRARRYLFGIPASV